MMKRSLTIFTVLAAGGLLLSCSDAPMIERAANRIVLVELFSTPLDE